MTTALLDDYSVPAYSLSHDLCRKSIFDRVRKETFFDVDQPGERNVPTDIRLLRRISRIDNFDRLRIVRLMQSTGKTKHVANTVFLYDDFMQLATNRMIMGLFRYGSIIRQSIHRQQRDILSEILSRIHRYDTQPNLEPLVDIYNMVKIEWLIDFTFEGKSITESLPFTIGMGLPFIDPVASMESCIRWYRSERNKTYLLDMANIAASEFVVHARWGKASYFCSV